MSKAKPILAAMLLAVLLTASVNPLHITEAKINQRDAPSIKIATKPNISGCQRLSTYKLISGNEGESLIEIPGYDGKDFPRDVFANVLMATGECGATMAIATVSPPPKSVWDEVIGRSDEFGNNSQAQSKVSSVQSAIRNLPSLLNTAKFKINFLGQKIEFPIPTDGLQQVVNQITVKAENKRVVIVGPKVSSQLRQVIIRIAQIAANKKFS